VTVAVVTDSAATIPAGLAEELGIVVVPLRLAIGADDHRDGELDPEVLLAHTGDVTTSGPTPSDFVDVIESAPTTDGVVIVTVSREIAQGTFLSARAAAGAIAVPTRIVDTGTAAGAEGLVVLAAARAAARGASLDGVEAAALRVVGRVRLIATLPNLDHLVRSGHVPQAAAWAARWVGLHPVVEVRSGRISPSKPALSETAAHKAMLAAWRRTIPAAPATLHVAALHSLAADAARALLAGVAAEVEPAEAFIGTFGTAMLVHAGPGVAGLAWWWEDPAQDPGVRRREGTAS
jgi:DegV family protein with EDD domain